jgi:hypothetical protein
MELCLKRKIPLLVLAACIFFAAAFTEILSADTHDHDCIGPDCSICLIIKAGQNFLKTLKFTGFLLFAAFLTLLAHVFKRYIGLNAYPLSPVTLKVRFNS